MLGCDDGLWKEKRGSIAADAGDDDSDSAMSEGTEAPSKAASQASDASSGSNGGGGGSRRAAVAMAVGAGSFTDPADLQGLSHYLEHMLFMGSEEFPEENAYDAFLVQHAGSSNGYTEAEYTNFHFDVEPSALLGALRRFSAFFKAPLFLTSALEREVHP